MYCKESRQFIRAAEKGDYEKCHALYSKHKRLKTYPYLIRPACQSNNVDIVDMITTHGKWSLIDALYGLCESGNLCLFERLVGDNQLVVVNNFRELLCLASKFGHLNIVQYICKQRPTGDVTSAMFVAFTKGFREIFDYLMANMSYSKPELFLEGCRNCEAGGIVSMALEQQWDGLDFDEGITVCIRRSRHYRLVKRMLEMDPFPKDFMETAMESLNHDVTGLLIQKYGCKFTKKSIPSNLPLYKILVQSGNVKVSQKKLESMAQWRTVVHGMAILYVYFDIPKDLTRKIRTFLY